MFCCFENDEIVINDGDDGPGEERSATPSNASFAVCVHLCQIEFWINKVELKSRWQKTIHGTQKCCRPATSAASVKHREPCGKKQQQQQQQQQHANLHDFRVKNDDENDALLANLIFYCICLLGCCVVRRMKDRKGEKERNSNWKKGRLPRLSPSSSTWNVTSWHSATARGR